MFSKNVGMGQQPFAVGCEAVTASLLYTKDDMNSLQALWILIFVLLQMSTMSVFSIFPFTHCVSSIWFYLLHPKQMPDYIIDTGWRVSVCVHLNANTGYSPVISLQCQTICSIRLCLICYSKLNELLCNR